MRLTVLVTSLVGKEWVPVSVKLWWYSEPPGVNDLRVTIAIVLLLIAITFVIAIASAI
jgi:hypothetical protein